jgi:hypothetical protein
LCPKHHSMVLTLLVAHLEGVSSATLDPERKEWSP